MISVGPPRSNTKLYGIQINHRDSHKTPDSKYYLPSLKQMFVSKATASPRWLTLCGMHSEANIGSLSWQPPRQHANHIKTPSAHADKLICMMGRRVDKHTRARTPKFTVQIQCGRLISVLSDHLYVNLFIQPTFIEELF